MFMTLSDFSTCTTLELNGRNSSLGVATRYELDGSGIESRWRHGFPHPSRPDLEPILLPVELLPGLFPGGEAAGA
jgi:hypothetical protein